MSTFTGLPAEARRERESARQELLRRVRAENFRERLRNSQERTRRDIEARQPNLLERLQQVELPHVELPHIALPVLNLRLPSLGRHNDSESVQIEVE